MVQPRPGGLYAGAVLWCFGGAMEPVHEASGHVEVELSSSGVHLAKERLPLG